MKTLVVPADGPGVRIVRARGGPLRVDAALLDPGPHAPNGRLRLCPPAGWTAEPCGPRRWRVWPRRVDPGRPGRFRLECLGANGVDARRHIIIDVPVSFDITSDFDPAASALLVRNRAADLGEYRPRRDVFAATWPGMPRRLAGLLFDGLYSDVVFLSAGPRRGGLCSGMARWALARSLGQEPAPASREAAVDRIAVYHGRQLRDRALLSALPWFVRGSPAAAYRAVRRDLLRTGRTDRALDLAVPKLWRRDVLNALVAEGHTVVPVRLVQERPDRATLEVYDPNHPDAVTSGKPRAIVFDLQRDRYAYGSLVSMEQRNVGIIAVRQHAYAANGTAVLATLGSLILSPARGLRSLLGRGDRG